jgi:hypothetical protein
MQLSSNKTMHIKMVGQRYEINNMAFLDQQSVPVLLLQNPQSTPPPPPL